MLPKCTMNKLGAGEQLGSTHFLFQGKGGSMNVGYLTQKKPANEALKSLWGLACLSARKFMPLAIIWRILGLDSNWKVSCLFLYSHCWLYLCTLCHKVGRGGGWDVLLCLHSFHKFASYLDVVKVVFCFCNFFKAQWLIFLHLCLCGNQFLGAPIEKAEFISFAVDWRTFYFSLGLIQFFYELPEDVLSSPCAKF